MKRTGLVVIAIGAGLVLTGFPQMLLAGSCYRAASYVSYAYPVVAKQVTVVKEVPVYVAAFTPVVAVGYVAPAVYTPPVMPAAMPAMPQAMPQDPCAQLKDRVLALERLLANGPTPTYQATAPVPSPPAATRPEQVPAPAAIPSAPPAIPSAPPAPPQQGAQEQAPKGLTAAQVIFNRCAECHTAGRAKGTFPLCGEDGRLLLLTPEQIRKTLSAVKGRPGTPPTMPKGKPPLTDEEFAAMLELVDMTP